MDNILYVVHCIDTEGPLKEELEDTFIRINSIFNLDLSASRGTLEKLQKMEIPLAGKERAVAELVSPNLLNYNENWNDIECMLERVCSDPFRTVMPDDFGGKWAYSWHCVDHIGLNENPRRKDLGYGSIFRFYKNFIQKYKSCDELNWHFHPVALNGSPTASSTNYIYSYASLYNIIARRILQDNWFPTTNRAGFHSTRPDSHLFLEQWLPFDFSNQYCKNVSNQPDLADGRFGDWRRAPDTWRGYHPKIHDYQSHGNCKRYIFRCLNVGTRHRNLTLSHVEEAFQEARDHGSAILAFTDHDYRDIGPDVDYMRGLLVRVKQQYKNVKIKYSGANSAAIHHLNLENKQKIFLTIELVDQKKIIVECKYGSVFGAQPFLAICTREKNYYHENLDEVVAGKVWSFTLDDQTFTVNQIKQIGVGASGDCGNYSVSRIDVC